MIRTTLAASLFVLGLMVLAGCDQPKPTPTTQKEGGDDHDHGPGPHGGTVADFGKYHCEFTVDHDKKEATVYILGADEKTPAPVKADKLSLSIANSTPPIQIDLLPADAKDGKASKFVGTHEALGKKQEFSGTITGIVDGKPFAGDFKEEPPKK